MDFFFFLQIMVFGFFSPDSNKRLKWFFFSYRVLLTYTIHNPKQHNLKISESEIDQLFSLETITFRLFVLIHLLLKLDSYFPESLELRRKTFSVPQKAVEGLKKGNLQPAIVKKIVDILFGKCLSTYGQSGSDFQIINPRAVQELFEGW